MINRIKFFLKKVSLVFFIFFYFTFFSCAIARAFQGSSSADISSSRFSLNYNDVDLNPKNLNKKSIKKNNSDSEVFLYKIDRQIEVTEYQIKFEKIKAVETEFKIKNISNEPSKVLRHFKFLDQKIKFKNPKVFYSMGGGQNVEYPMKHSDFSPLEKNLDALETFEISPSHGRSSSDFLPFFNLMNEKRTEGLIVAIGWTGQWKFKIKNDYGDLRIEVTMEDFNLQLLPHESISLPSVLTMKWKGNFQTAQNNFRLLLKEYYVPKKKDGTAFTLQGLSPIDGGLNAIDFSQSRFVLDKALENKLPFNAFWLDAGWYNPKEKDWVWTGDWLANSSKYPDDSLARLGQNLVENEKKLILWFEPERITKKSENYKRISTENPDWLLQPKGRSGTGGLDDPDVFTMINLGHPEALKWITKEISQQVAKNQVGVFRQDMNMHRLLELWRDQDQREQLRTGLKRKGITEIKYINGLYKMWDDLKLEFSDLVIDNCSAGGRRIDLKSIKKTVLFSRSDKAYSPGHGYNWDPYEAQNEFFGISIWLPYHGLGVIPQSNLKKYTYAFRSGIGNLMTYGAGFDPSIYPLIKKFMSEASVVTPLLDENFYLLEDWNKTTQRNHLIKEDIIRAAQFSSMKERQSLIVIYTRSSTKPKKINIKPYEIDTLKRYRVFDTENTFSKMISGQELAKSGFSFQVNPESAYFLILQEVDLEDKFL